MLCSDGYRGFATVSSWMIRCCGSARCAGASARAGITGSNLFGGMGNRPRFGIASVPTRG